MAARTVLSQVNIAGGVYFIDGSIDAGIAVDPARFVAYPVDPGGGVIWGSSLSNSESPVAFGALRSRPGAR